MTSHPRAVDTVVFARGLRLSDHARAACDFEVFPGEVFVVVGRTGSGKSALIETLAGVRRTPADELLICGTPPERVFTDEPVIVGAALHNVAFERGLTVHETVALMATCYGNDWLVAPALDLLDLDAWRHERVDRLPRPLFQRLVLSVALMNDPVLFLADDPTHGLDLEGTRRLHQLLRRRRERGRTSVFTTTRLEEAERLADRIAVLDAGRLITVDTPEQLRRASAGLEQITFEVSPSSLDETRLRAVESVVDVHVGDDQYSVLCRDGFTALRSLMRVFDDLTITPTTLTIQRPTLEDAVVELTARHSS